MSSARSPRTLRRSRTQGSILALTAFTGIATAAFSASLAPSAGAAAEATTATTATAAVPASWLPPAGFPGPNNTGVPTGTILKKTGALIVTRDGTVLDRLDVAGCIQVRANNVTITRSRVRCTTAEPIRQSSPYKGLNVRDSEIDAGGNNNALSAASGLTMLRNEMHHLLDGPRVGSNALLEGNWIHDLVRKPSTYQASGTTHNDAIQTTGGSNVVLRGNSLQAYRFATQDPHNGVLMMGSESGNPIGNWLVEGNYMDGGSVSVNMRTDTRLSGTVVFRANKIGPNSRYQQSHLGLNRAGVTWAASNVWSATGQPATR